MRLDNYGAYPSGMKEYLSIYGWHFSKKMCEWAISRMYKDEKEIKTEQSNSNYTRDKVDLLLKRYNLKLENNKGYATEVAKPFECIQQIAAKSDYKFETMSFQKEYKNKDVFYTIKDGKKVWKDQSEI